MRLPKLSTLAHLLATLVANWFRYDYRLSSILRQPPEEPPRDALFHPGKPKHHKGTK